MVLSQSATFNEQKCKYGSEIEQFCFEIGILAPKNCGFRKKKGTLPTV
jgi:hypothetical protein